MSSYYVSGMVLNVPCVLYHLTVKITQWHNESVRVQMRMAETSLAGFRGGIQGITC